MEILAEIRKHPKVSLWKEKEDVHFNEAQKIESSLAFITPKHQQCLVKIMVRQSTRNWQPEVHGELMISDQVINEMAFRFSEVLNRSIKALSGYLQVKLMNTQDLLHVAKELVKVKILLVCQSNKVFHPDFRAPWVPNTLLRKLKT